MNARDVPGCRHEHDVPLALPDPTSLEAPVLDLGLSVLLRVLSRAEGDDGERGDVPGWVLITVMTAALVTVIWALLEPQIRTLLSNALSSVSGPGGR